MSHASFAGLPLEQDEDFPQTATRRFVDDVIDPREIGALDMLQNKRDRNPPKKHGNIPL